MKIQNINTIGIAMKGCTADEINAAWKRANSGKEETNLLYTAEDIIKANEKCINSNNTRSIHHNSAKRSISNFLKKYLKSNYQHKNLLFS